MQMHGQIGDVVYPGSWDLLSGVPHAGPLVTVDRIADSENHAHGRGGASRRGLFGRPRALRWQR